MLYFDNKSFATFKRNKDTDKFIQKEKIGKGRTKKIYKKTETREINKSSTSQWINFYLSKLFIAPLKKVFHNFCYISILFLCFLSAFESVSVVFLSSKYLVWRILKWRKREQRNENFMLNSSFKNFMRFLFFFQTQAYILHSPLNSSFNVFSTWNCYASN